MTSSKSILLLTACLCLSACQTTRFFQQKVDHFAFNTENSFFSQKYLVNDQYYRYDKGPILFYCGNEGSIDFFYNNTGFLTETVAQELHGLVVFMEHRYFGESWPFGNEEDSLKAGNNKYLTSLQALNDYVIFLNDLKAKLGCGPNECPVVAFGGSYGGMLAAWIRMKFPNVVDASLAASAPIYQFLNREDLNQTLFYSIITKNYEHGSCSQTIHSAYQLLSNLIDQQSKQTSKFFSNFFQFDYEDINRAINPCEPIVDTKGLIQLREYMDTAYSYMAMTNYPQAGDFFQSMPAWPANASCIPLEVVNSNNSTVYELFSAIKASTDVFYNYANNTSCSDLSQGDGGSSDSDTIGWNILACADMVLPMKSNGVTDMFYDLPCNKKQCEFENCSRIWVGFCNICVVIILGDFESYRKTCEEKYGVTPDYDWALDFYGGRTDEEMLGFSKIFFSNGMLDPWSGGSPTTFLSEDLPVNYMSQAAHHNDLRLPGKGDPESVIQGRLLELQYIKKWIQYKLPLGYFNNQTLSEK